MREEEHQLVVLQVLIRTGVLSLWTESPGWTHWRDGPAHQEWPEDQVRPQGRPQSGPTPTDTKGDQSPPWSSQEGSVR